MPIVPIYAAVLALVFVVLGFRTIRLRRRVRVALGSGDDERLRRAARAHANFAEYVPIALLLIFFVESAGASRMYVHVLCACLLAGRLLHAAGVSQVPEPHSLRVAGMFLTFTPIIAAALWLLAAALSH